MSKQYAVTPIHPEEPAPAAPTELDAGDAAYHDFVVARANGIEALMQQQQQIATEIAGRQGALVAWQEYVAGKYGLGQGDRVTQEHRIVRAGDGA